MLDFKGQELNVGDRVIYTMQSSGGLQEGLIHSISPKQLVIQHKPPIKHKSGTYSWTQKFEDRVIQPEIQCIKVG